MPATLRDASLRGVRRGLQFYSQGRHVEALEAFNGALALDYTICLTWVGKGKALLELQRISEAEAAFERALSLDPTNPEALTGKAQAHEASHLERMRHMGDGIDLLVPEALDGIGAIIHFVGHALVALLMPH